MQADVDRRLLTNSTTSAVILKLGTAHRAGIACTIGNDELSLQIPDVIHHATKNKANYREGFELI